MLFPQQIPKHFANVAEMSLTQLFFTVGNLDCREGPARPRPLKESMADEAEKPVSTPSHVPCPHATISTIFLSQGEQSLPVPSAHAAVDELSPSPRIPKLLYH